MNGFDWVSGMVDGLLAGLSGLVAGLSWAIVGVAIGLAAWFVGTVVGWVAKAPRAATKFAGVRFRRALGFLGIATLSLVVLMLLAGRFVFWTVQPMPASLGSPGVPSSAGVGDRSGVIVLAEASAGNAEALPPRQQLFSDLVDTWQADVYPSDKAAVRALVARIDTQIGSLIGDEEHVAVIEVQGSMRHELLVQVVDALKKTHPDSRITLTQTTDDSVMPPTDKQTVIVHVQSHEGGKGSTPYVRMQAAGWEHSRTEQAGFVNKPWADDFATFANESATGTYVVAVSQRPATSAEEAERNAVAVAAESLEHRVSDRMNSQRRSALWRSADAERWLAERIVAELQNSPMVTDRFVQRLEAPYGEVWQTSLLVDASPKNIASLARKCDWLMTLEERGTRRTALSVVGVIALVCLVYAGLNAVTRGYFVWSLRALAIALIMGGIFVVLLLRSSGGRVTVTYTEPTVLEGTTADGQGVYYLER